MIPEQYTERVKGNKPTAWLYFIPKNEVICLYIVKYAYI